MARDEWKQLSEAKKSHRSAAAEGNRTEEAKWANVIGNLYKNRGELRNAIKWLTIDYQISSQSLSPHHRFASCQSLGDAFLLLKDFKNALFYQKKHLELAKDENDPVEQQRANTQLGRTYHDMLTQDKDDHSSVRSARKYFKCALELARFLKENPPSPSDSSFLREYIDAHNNMGMLEMDLENFREARRILARGIEICAEEEFPVDDATRTRLHNNIGAVYMHLRVWDKAKKHMETDIKICKRIGHCEGEAKGYINYGLVHYKTQRYDEALECYRRASNLAKAVEGNDSLLEEIEQNIESAKEAKEIMAGLRKDEQHLKKLIRDVNNASGKPGERKCLLQLNAFLDSLADKARTIEFWPKFRDFGKRKKIITSKLCDKEKLSESYFLLGEAYGNLRDFDKACKWYSKSWEIYKSIGNLEEQARTKNEIGNALDSKGDWKNALEAYKESYRIAVEAKHPSVQLLALENMHYCHLIRFGDDDETRRLQLEIKKLKQSKDTEFDKHGTVENFCSETDSEGGIHISEDKGDAYCSTDTSASVEENDEAPLASLRRSTRSTPKLKPIYKEQGSNAFTASSSKSGSSHQSVGRKRCRLVLSDDEDETCFEANGSKGRTQSSPKEDVGTSDEFKNERNAVDPVFMIQDESAVASKSTNPTAHVEESCSSYRTAGPMGTTQNGIPRGPASTEDECVTIKINNELMLVKASLFTADTPNLESLKAELACLYYLQLPEEKRSDGLLPVIPYIKCGDRVIESLEMIEPLKDDMGKGFIEAFVARWVQRRLIKSYIDGCKEFSETPNIKLLKKLNDLEVSDDEINVSSCELQDLSITPFLNALYTHKTFAMLNLSHNLLGNGTMEKLQQVFSSSSQKYGGLTLDLHCNLFGPTALIQICECPSLFSRLEVLNISGNRITDSSASCLETILKKCRALCSLNLEGCSIGSRTVLKIIDALDSESALEHLFIGHNNSITAGAVVNLLSKLTALKSFSELGLNGLKLSKPVLDGLCLLAKNRSCFSALMLGETSLGNDYASLVTKVLYNGTKESVKLDLSYCRLTCDYIVNLSADESQNSCILELNLAGNPIEHEGSNALSSLLMNPHCCLKVLVLEKCHLGFAGILRILQALAENTSLEDLNLADNADLDQRSTPPDSTTKGGSTEILQPMTDIPEVSQIACVPEGVEPGKEGLCPVYDDLSQLEVADSEEVPIRAEAAGSGIDDSCASSSQRNAWSHETQFTLEVSTAISKAKTLQLLDLSNNGFSIQDAEKLYVAWSSSRLYPGYRHVKNQTIHLVTKGRKCCIRPCCKRNLL